MIVSILAWDVADAHFNLAITLADFVMNVIKDSDEMQEHLINMCVIIIAQICGAFFGNALSQASVINLGTEN